MVYGIAVDVDGMALRPLDGSRAEERRFVREPRWIVTRWTGFVDGHDRPIYCHDVLAIGGETVKEAATPVLFRKGRYVLLVPWELSELNERALALYCQPAYIRLTAVIGNTFEPKWAARFGNMPLSHSGKH